MKEQIELLIEEYENRLHTLSYMIGESNDVIKENRLQTKASCYRTFISELRKINNK